MKNKKMLNSQMLSQTIVIILISAIFAIPVYGAKKAYLRTGKSIDLSPIGVNLKICKGLEANPAGSIKIYSFMQTRGSESKKIEAYNPQDLWLRDQLAGKWISREAALSIYTLTMLPPKNITKFHQNLVLKKAFDEWKEKQSKNKVEWSDQNISDWLNSLTNAQFTTLPPLKRGAPRQSTTKIFTTDSLPNDLFYIVISNYSKETPILIHYKISPHLDRSKSLKTIASTIASMRLFKPKLNSGAAKKRIVSNSRSLKKTNKERSPEYIASRDAVIKAIQNLKDWWYVETDNFIMVANIKNKKTARDLSTNLEKSRTVYTQFYPLKTPLKAVSVARMFEERDQYVSYVGPALRWSGGVWMASIKELVVSPMNWGSKVERRKMMIETTLHEAFHQYLFFATGEKNNAMWFNEGNAQFFETIKIRSGKPSIGINTNKAEMMKQLTSLNRIRQMLTMGPQEFYSEKGRKNNYALAWGLVFFMQKGAPVMKEKNSYHEIPEKYYDAMITTGNSQKATEIAWKDVDIEKFTSDFQKFWNSKTLVSKAIRFDPLKK